MSNKKARKKQIYQFTTNHLGWECDEHGYIVQDEAGKLCVQEYSHGMEMKPVYGNKAIRALEEYQQQYRKHLEEIEEALRLIKKDSNK